MKDEIAVNSPSVADASTHNAPNADVTETERDLVGASVFSRRQVFGAAIAGLVFGVGAGMAYVTRSTLDPERQQSQPTTIDQGFVNDMLDHHDQAVEMSLITLGRPGISGSTRQFATEVIIFQRYEIGLLEGRLNAWGVERAEETRKAMVWMGMGTSVKSMPGMASITDLDRLRSASGRDADREFLTLMRAHHQGGIHMAEYARDKARDREIVGLASRMAYNQALEVTEYTRALDAIPSS